MIRTMLGRTLAAALLCGAAAAALASGYGGVSGGSSPNSNPIPYDSGIVVPTVGVVYGAGSTFTINRLVCVPVSFRDNTTLAELGTRVNSVSTTGGKIAFLLYGDTFIPGTGHRPYGLSGPLGATGDIVTSSFASGGAIAAANGVAASAVAVTRNTRYWFCYVTDSNINLFTQLGGSGLALVGDPAYTNQLSSTVAYTVYQTLTYPASNTATSFPTSDGTGWTFSAGLFPVSLFKPL